VEMRCMVRLTDFHEHPNDNAEKTAQLWHRLILPLDDAGGHSSSCPPNGLRASRVPQATAR
jgi:hypothetical protein